MNPAMCQQALDGVGSGVAASLHAVDCAGYAMAQEAFGGLFSKNGVLLPALTILLTLYVAFFAFLMACLGGLVDPDVAVDFGENRSGTISGFEVRIGVDAVFGEQTFPDAFAVGEGIVKGGAGGFDQFGAILLTFGNLLVGITLFVAAFCGPGQSALKLFQFSAIGG